MKLDEIRLGVNIDHVATVRNARGTSYPDPLKAANIVKEAGGLLLDADLNPLDADLSYETRVSFIAAANQKILDEIMSQIN